MRKLLILDIDHTILFATENSKILNYPTLKPDFSFNNINIYNRPHLNSCLGEASCIYDLAIWTTADIRYALKIRELIFDPLKIELKFINSQRDCEFDSNGAYKNLDKIQDYNKHNIICLDDSRRVYRKHSECHVSIMPYYGNPNDVELLRILKVLK